MEPEVAVKFYRIWVLWIHDVGQGHGSYTKQAFLNEKAAEYVRNACQEVFWPPGKYGYSRHKVFIKQAPGLLMDDRIYCDSMSWSLTHVQAFSKYDTDAVTHEQIRQAFTNCVIGKK